MTNYTDKLYTDMVRNTYAGPVPLTAVAMSMKCSSFTSTASVRSEPAQQPPVTSNQKSVSCPQGLVVLVHTSHALEDRLDDLLLE